MENTTDGLGERRDLFTPENSPVALIDYEPWVAPTVRSHDRALPANNIAAQAAEAHDVVPAVLAR